MNEPRHLSPGNFLPRIVAPRAPVAADASPAPRITLHIEELVLHGAAPGDSHRIADAIQSELHRMISDQGAPAWATTSASEPRLEAGPGPAAFSAGPNAVGAGVARAVYQATAEGKATP